MRGPGNGGVGQDAADVLDGRRRCDLDRDMCLVAYGLAMRTGLLIVDMARIKQNGILGQLLRDSWLAFTEGLL